MRRVSFDTLLRKIKNIKFDNFDLIIGIGRGGIIPASIISYLLKKELRIVNIKFRDDDNKIIYKNPKITNKDNFKINNKIKNIKILLVDDVSRTGKTLEAAKGLFSGNRIKTFVINGNADYSLFDTKECLRLPWTRA